jgi:uncharacterized oligopeptide transporter (OPT) family protein
MFVTKVAAVINWLAHQKKKKKKKEKKKKKKKNKNVTVFSGGLLP